MQNHLNQIAEIIEASRFHEEGFLIDSKGAALKVVQYLQYHFETSKRISIKIKEECKDFVVYNFQEDQLD